MFVGTKGYIAPEILKCRKYYNDREYDPSAADIYSLGIII